MTHRLPRWLSRSAWRVTDATARLGPSRSASGRDPSATEVQRRCPEAAPWRGHAVAWRTTPRVAALGVDGHTRGSYSISRDGTQRDGTEQARSFDPRADAERTVGSFARRTRRRHDRI